MKKNAQIKNKHTFIVLAVIVCEIKLISALEGLSQNIFKVFFIARLINYCENYSDRKKVGYLARQIQEKKNFNKSTVLSFVQNSEKRYYRFQAVTCKKFAGIAL